MQLGSSANKSKGNYGSGFAMGSFEVKSEINVTPLVDVCLVLLIIFMVVTPLLQTGVDVQLPSTTKPEKIPESQKQVTIAIKANGDIFQGQNWIPQEKFEAQMKDLFAQSPEKDIVIKADRRLKYKDVRKVMEMINDAGYSGVGLITTRKDTSAPAH
jgi:biopolymer transport protein ExbD